MPSPQSPDSLYPWLWELQGRGSSSIPVWHLGEGSPCPAPGVGGHAAGLPSLCHAQDTSPGSVALEMQGEIAES